MRLAVGADHAGRNLLTELVDFLRTAGHELLDTNASATHEYPDVAMQVAREVAAGRSAFGLLVCGTGVGMALGTSRVAGCRPVLCSEPYTAKLARAHNDANILCLGARVIGLGLAHSILEAFLNQAFEGGRHQKRLSRIEELIEDRDRP